MYTRQVTERVGEYLGPIDWAYDFWAHSWDCGGCCNPRCVEDGVRNLIRLLREPDRRWDFCSDGVSQEITLVGMYDGWPYWKPTPSVCVRSTFGAEWHSAIGLRITPHIERMTLTG